MQSFRPSSRLKTVGLAALALSLAVGVAQQALAWGATGHRLIGVLAIQSLPDEIPAFLRTADVAQEVGELAREPDRSRGAGQPHDTDLDAGHFVDLDDAGKVNGGPTLSTLPPTREGYEAALHEAGTDMTKSGYLPYNIADGFQQLAKDFAFWRIETAALRTTTDPKDHAWIARDLALRQQLIIRDLGYWAHFVGDGSQPMHVSIHYNGWGAYPNPHNYSQDKIHGPFEGDFVRDHVTADAVRAAMTPYQPCPTPILACAGAYLSVTAGQVEPLYQLWGTGAFTATDTAALAPAQAFTAQRVAAGASELRNLILDAWRLSATESVGYKPSITVAAAEAGAPVPMAILYGDD
jgi:hypothetical protein